ncbi:transcription factor SPT20 homolog [Drosophila busckii]|uniref:transcription factor SPT20 homolog n=1 Tax=Drosophila busckii TaxID=30019 RepID=UPI00083EEAA2|nr:transcription factor SPT20 homolog [Drosophila busckii]
MVRRKSIMRNLANHLSMTAYQNLMAPNADQMWLRSLQQQSLMQQQQQQQQQPVPQSLVSSMHNMCNKMAGALPRMPAYTQPEYSSRKLNRLRRELMSYPPEFITPAMMPVYQQQQQRLVRPPPAAAAALWAAPAPMQSLPREYIKPPRQALTMKAFLNRQRAQSGDLSNYLRQQLLQLKQQRRQQQQQQQQQPPAAKQAARTNYRPFNFGKCASSYTDCTTTEKLPPAAPHAGILKKPTRFEPTIAHSAEDFNYVKLAKQMGKPTPTTAPRVQREQLTREAKRALKRTQVISIKEESRMLAKESLKSNKSKCRQREHKSYSTQTSTTTLTNSELCLESQTSDKSQPQNSQLALDRLANDIDVNLTALQQLVATELKQKAAMEQRFSAPELQTAAPAACGRQSSKLLLTAAELQLLQNILLEEQQSSNSNNNKPPIAPKPQRQLNLNKLFESHKLQCNESNPLWQQLMQLATQLCNNKRPSSESRLNAGSEHNQKQYSIYLMVASDDEDEQQQPQQQQQQQQPQQQQQQQSPAQPAPKLAACNPADFALHCSHSYQQEHPEALLTKRRKRRLRRRLTPFGSTAALSSTSPRASMPRRPLHWPKLDYSAFMLQQKKLLRRLPSRTRCKRCGSATRNWRLNHQLNSERDLKKSYCRLLGPVLASKALSNLPYASFLRT